MERRRTAVDGAAAVGRVIFREREQPDRLLRALRAQVRGREKVSRHRLARWQAPRHGGRVCERDSSDLIPVTTLCPDKTKPAPVTAGELSGEGVGGPERGQGLRGCGRMRSVGSLRLFTAGWRSV